MSKENSPDAYLSTKDQNVLGFSYNPKETFEGRLDTSTMGTPASIRLLVNNPEELKKICIDTWKRKGSVFWKYNDMGGYKENVLVTAMRHHNGDNGFENITFWVRFDDGEIDVELEFD